MTCGIYAIYWEQPDLIYVGQSMDIEARFAAHKGYLKRGDHANWKISEAYHKYGLPEFLILEECSASTLLLNEVHWVSEFNNVLNIQEAGVPVGTGVKNPNSKHSKRRILRAFVYLYKYGFPQHKVAALTGIPRGTLSHITCGKAHHWLQQDYPDEFSLLQKNATSNEKLKSSKVRSQTFKGVPLSDVCA